MKEMNVYKKSLELLDEFLAETSSPDLSKLINQYKSLDIKGPTFSEYLEEFQNNFEGVNWHSKVNKITMVDLSECNIYQNKDSNYYYVPPPSEKKYTSNKKDSSIIEESFFLV